MKPSKHRLSSLAEDITIPEDAPFRARLHSLFGQIEKEFELLYLENLSLQEKLDHCMSKDLICSYERSAGVIAAGGSGANVITGNATNTGQSNAMQTNISTALGHDDGDTTALVSIIGGGGGSKGLKAKFTSSSNKVKASNKIKAQTSRIVSSFKAQTVVSQVTREFCGHKDGVWQVTAKVGQPIIGTASADHTACIWGIENGRCLLQYQGHAGSVNSVKFHQNRDLVLTGSGDGTAHIWQAAVNWESSKRGHSSEEELDDSDEQVEDRDRVDTLRTPLCEFTGPGGHSSVVVAADWLPSMDHRQIITGSWDRTAILWDVESREPVQTLTGHDHELTHVSAHASQRLVVTASRDSTFRLWDFRYEIPAVSVFQGHTESVTSTVFARDDKVVSGSDDRTVKVWELRNMRSALATIRTDSSVNRLAVSSGGIIAIPHDNRQIRLFDLNGQRVARLPRTSRFVSALCGRSLAYGGRQLMSKAILSAPIIAQAQTANVRGKSTINYRAQCSKDGTRLKKSMKKPKTMWFNPECCLDPCPDIQPRFDDLYYKASDKAKRKYTQTWVECPKMRIARKKICCADNIIPPTFQRRSHKRKTAEEECKPQPTNLLPCKSYPKRKCPRFILPGCKPARDPAKCGKPRPKTDCKKICTPYPSFSECTRKRKGPPRPIECHCLDIPMMCEVWIEFRRTIGKKKTKQN